MTLCAAHFLARPYIAQIAQSGTGAGLLGSAARGPHPTTTRPIQKLQASLTEMLVLAFALYRLREGPRMRGMGCVCCSCRMVGNVVVKRRIVVRQHNGIQVPRRSNKSLFLLDRRSGVMQTGSRRRMGS